MKDDSKNKTGWWGVSSLLSSFLSFISFCLYGYLHTEYFPNKRTGIAVPFWISIETIGFAHLLSDAFAFVALFLAIKAIKRKQLFVGIAALILSLLSLLLTRGVVL